MSLKISQLDLFQESSTLAKDIKIREVFIYKNNLYLRVKPVSWMLNSTLVQDKITKGFICAVNLESGNLCWPEGSWEVEKVSAELKWSK